MKHFLFSLFAILSTGPLFSQLIAPPSILTREHYEQTTETQDARAALQYINHINHIVAKLENFNDILILQQEYENLTDNNLNLEVVKDEPTVQVITQLLTFIKDMEKDYLKRLHAAQILEQEKRSALYKAIPSPASFLATNPAALALAIGTAGLTSIQNYYAAKASAEKEYTEKILDSKTSRLEYLHELNNELFFAQWRLIQHYKIPDAKRVTRNENELFLGFAKILEKRTKNQSPAETTENDKLVWEIFRNNEADMRELPFYWVTRAAAVYNAMHSAANYDDNDYKMKDLHYSCEQYFRLFKDAPIIRKDPTACAMALLYVASFQKPTSENERGVTKAWLKFIEDTARIPAWQTKFALAQLYKNKLGDVESAKRILRKAFLEVHACLVIWGRTGENIFYIASSFEKAEASSVEDREKKDRRFLLLPIDGWFWLKGALASLGVEPEEEFPLIDVCDPIERRLLKKDNMFLTRLVKVTPKKDSYLFEIPREDLREELSFSGIARSSQGTMQGIPEGARQYEWRYDTNTPPEDFDVCLKTKYGFSLIYFYKTDVHSVPELQEIRLATPWSQNEADCKVLFQKDGARL